MRKVQTMVVIAGLLFSLTASAGDKQAPTVRKNIEPLPRDLEIQLALSALPPHLRNDATVYVLNLDKGFEAAREGTNGFHALVARTGNDAFEGAWRFTEYRDDILIPISFDKAEGVRAHMRALFDIAEMQAMGTPPEELKRIINERYDKEYYKTQKRSGVSYMLSPILRTYANPDESDSVGTFNIPHVMYYAPDVSNEDIGGNPMSYPYVMGPRRPGPHEYIIQLLGITERAAINKEYEDMLARLCKIKAVWCLPKTNSRRQSHHAHTRGR